MNATKRSPAGATSHPMIPPLRPGLELVRIVEREADAEMSDFSHLSLRPLRLPYARLASQVPLSMSSLMVALISSAVDRTADDLNDAGRQIIFTFRCNVGLTI